MIKPFVVQGRAPVSQGRITKLPAAGTSILRLPDPSVPVNPQGAAAGRVMDQSRCPSDAHGCPACPHPASGPAILGSPNVFINGRPALRQEDSGVHGACCGPNTWVAVGGSKSVLINNRGAHRKGDADQHCGGAGTLIEGSWDVFFG